MPFTRPKLNLPKLEAPKLDLSKLKIPRISTTVAKPKSRTCIDGAIVRPTFTRAELINEESKLGRDIFGPIPAGHQREFFELEQNIWIWHESWFEGEEIKETTVRYEVRPSGVYKKLQGSNKNYIMLEDAELENFRRALHLYLDLAKEKLY